MRIFFVVLCAVYILLGIALTAVGDAYGYVLALILGGMFLAVPLGYLFMWVVGSDE